jgi:enamine deaminase RidA (YjgF/YER057c/UK114 family)
MASNTRFMNPSTIAKPGGYSHVVETTGPGRIVYIAGQLGLKPDGSVAGDFRAQVTQAFENLKSALAAVGAGFDDVVKINNYLVDIQTNLPPLPRGARQVRQHGSAAGQHHGRCRGAGAARLPVRG